MNVNRYARPAAILLVVLSAFATACDGDDDPDVAISTPEEGATVAGPDVEVCADVENFDLVEQIGEAPESGEGHIIFYLDQDAIPIDHDQPATTQQGSFEATAQTCQVWEDLDESEHSFAVQLVDNDDTALEEPVLDEVDVTVELEASPSPARTRTATPTETPEEEEEEPTATPTEEEEETGTPTETESPSPSP